MASQSAILSVLLEANTSEATAKLTKFDRQLEAVRRESRRRIEAQLGGEYHAEAFNRYEAALKRASRVARDRRAFKAELGANFNPGAFRAYERSIDQAEKSTRHLKTTQEETKVSSEKMGRSFGGIAAPAEKAATQVGKLAKAALAVGAAYAGIEGAKNALDTTLELGHATERLTAATSLDTKTASTWIETMRARHVSSTQTVRSFIGLDKQIRSAQDGSKTAKKAFDELGVSQDTLRSGRTDKVMEAVAQGLSKVKDPADRAAIAQQLFGRAAQGLLPVLKDGKKGVEDALTTTQKYGDFLQNKGSKSFKGAIDAQRELGQAGRGLKIAFAEAVLPTLVKAADAVLGFIKGMRSGTGAGGTFAAIMKTAFGAVKTAVGAVSTAIGFLIAHWPQIKAAAAPVIAWLVNAGQNAARFLVAAFNTIAPKAVSAFHTIRNLVGPVITAIINGFKSLEPTIGPFVRGFAGAVRTAFNVIKAIIVPVARVTIPIIVDAFKTMLAEARPIFHAIAGVVRGAFQTIKGVIEFFTGVFTLDFSKMWKGIKDMFGGAVKALVAIVKGIIGAMLAAAKGVMGAIGDGLKAAYGQVKDWLGGAMSGLLHIVTGFADDMFDAGKGIMSSIGHGFEAAFNFVWGTISGFINDIIGAIDLIPGVNIHKIGTSAPSTPHQATAGDVRAAGFATGGLVTQPGYFAGEEAPQHPEVILATNPAYRSRNLGLWAQAGSMLGVPGFQHGGIAGAVGGAVGSAVHAVESAPGALLSAATSVAQAVGGLLPHLPGIPNLPGWIAGLPSYLLGKATSFVKDKITGLFKSGQLGGAGGTGPSPMAGPPGVRRMIAAANEMASHNYNYEWGGGHNTTFSPTHGVGHGSGPGIGYDCSGAVSRMLHANGLLGSPLVSGGFMNYGSPGAGKWITLYSSPSHVFSEISGRYFGTSGQNPGGGANWIPTFPGDIGAITHPTGFAEGGIFEHAKQKTFGAFDPSKFSARDQAIFVKTGLLPGLAKGGIVGAAARHTPKKPPAGAVATAAAGGNPSSPSRGQVGAFYKIAHALWSRLSGKGALPAWASHEPRFHVQRTGYGGDPSWNARPYTTPSRQIYIPWNIVWYAEHPDNFAYSWAQEAMVHEMAHTNQNRSVISDHRLAEGGAQAWADQWTPRVADHWHKYGTWEHNDTTYADFVNYVKKHKGWNWIDHGQFARYAKGGIFGKAKAAAAKAPGFLRGGLYTASDYDAHGVGAYGLVSDVQSVPGFAELSNPPSSLNFSALGGLPGGTRIDVTYRGKTITIPKLDKGGGGPPLAPATVRAVDLTIPAARELNFPFSAGLANVIVSAAGAGGGGGGGGGGVTVTTSGGGGSGGSPTTTVGGKPVKPKPKFIPTKVPKLKLPFKLSSVPAGATPVISGLVGELNQIYDPDRGTIAALTDRIGVVGQIDDQKVSEYQTAHPATDTSTGLIETSSTDASGNTTTHHTVDQKFVDMRVAQLTKLIIWQTQVRDYLKAARRKIDILLHRLHQALEIRRRFAQKIHDDIERNVARIQELQAQEKVPKISRRHKSDLAASVQALKNQNKQLGGNEMRAGDGGVLGKIGKEITSLTDTASTMRDNRLQIVGASGIGGTLATSKLDLKTTADELAVISPKSVQAALAAATAADVAAGGGATTPAVDDSGTIQMLQQLLDQAHLATSVSQEQLSILQATPPFGGSFAQGGVVPGPAGAPRTIIAHAGERITPTGGPGHVRVMIEDHRTRVFYDDVEQVVNHVTRGQSRNAMRTLPGHKARF